MAHKMLWLVFYTLGVAMLCALLYNVLFVYNYDVVNTEVTVYDGKVNTGVDKSRYMFGSKGALWVAADNIQNACSWFFYEYAYLPMVHQNDEIDQQLGVDSDYYMMDGNGVAIPDAVDTAGGYKNTPANIRDDRLYEAPSSSGWYHEDNYS